MVFDVTLLIGNNTSLEYNANGEIIEKSTDTALVSYPVPDDRVGKFTVIKDPVENHVNLYAIELYDLPMDIISAFKINMVSAIIIRLGTGTKNGLKNFDLHKIFIRPITVYEHALQPDKIVNDVIVKGISLTSNAILLDAAFGAELEKRRDYESAVTFNTPKAADQIDISTVSKGRQTSGVVSIDNYNPGNIINTGINWDGEITSPYDKFEKFLTPELGFKALANNLKARVSKSNGTLREVMMAWAPPNENDTEAYIAFICKSTGLNPDSKIQTTDFANLAKAISWYEGDNKVGYYSNEMIDRGMAMAGVNSTVSRQVAELNTKNNIMSVAGTNPNKPINVFNYVKGSAVLDTILQRMKEKYKIEVDASSMTGMKRSSFIYKNITLPGVATLELLKKVHKDYPAYYVEVPWILDDMRFASDASKMGKTWYTEVGILGINSLETKSITNQGYPNAKSAAYSFMNVQSIRPFYTETKERIDAQTIVFKELPTGIETVYKGNPSMEIAAVPDTTAAGKTTEGISKLQINSYKTTHIEAAFDAVEFSKRLGVFKSHVYTNPQIIRTSIKSNDPNFIEFGYSYTFDGHQLNKVTPYKIKMEFTNVNNQYELVYEVDFYKGVDINQG